MRHKRLPIKAVAGLLAALWFGGLQAQAQTAIPASAALPSSRADTSKPGFIWRFYQVAIGIPNTTQASEDMLAGLLGDNIADPGAQGVAIAPAPAPASPTVPLNFEIATVVNVSRNGSDNAGNFTTDDVMPGVPGTTASTDNIAAEILNWIEFPAPGVYELIVNSDDGFRTSLGGSSPNDKFGIVVGECSCGRGASDTSFKVKIDQAGLYAMRTTWENAGGGANIEIINVKADGTKVLVNDTANGGLRSFRAVTGGSPVFARKVIPAPGSTGVSFDTSIEIELVDGQGTAVDTASVKLLLDSTQVNAQVTKNAGVTSVKYVPPSFFIKQTQHQVKLDYTAGGAAASVTWSFTVVNYGTLTAADAVQPDTSKPGFIWDYFQNGANQNNDNQTTEITLAGGLKAADGSLLPNLADPAVQGPAIGPGTTLGTATNSLIRWEIPTVINMGAGADGNFSPDDSFPGSPGTGGDSNGQKAQALFYVDLPKGVVTMGVNSDDGFRTTAGPVKDALAAIFLGEFNGGRGAADTIFKFLVQDAGVYAFRVIWENGGGGFNIEIFTVKADGTKVLVNDAANSGLKAYRAKVGGDVPVNPYVKSLAPAPGATGVPNQPTFRIELVDGSAKQVDTNSVKLKVQSADVAATVNKTADTTTATYTPATEFIPESTVSAQLTFADNTGTTRSAAWTFTTTFVTKDTLFIETEDADFGGGQYITTNKIGMNGPYDGGAYADLGTDTDAGIDWNAPGGNAGQPYRPNTGLAAGKPNGSAGLSRGYFDVKVNHTLGWNDNGDWQNYTRDFPTPAKDYEVFCHASSGGAPIDVELAQITAGVGLPDAQQVKKVLGYLRPGRATAGWDTLEVFRLTDTNGAPLVVNLGGKVTLRSTTLPNSNNDTDYYAFRPKRLSIVPTLSVSRSGNNIVLTFANGVLQSADKVTGPFNNVPGATSPLTVPIETILERYYRTFLQP